MDLSGQASQARFASYVEALVEVIGHADCAEPLNDYCVGLLMPGERKSVEPMAAIVAPARVSAKHQSLLHLVGQAPWSDEAVLQKIRELVLPGIERQGRIEAWIVDDTGFTKKGTHSVGEVGALAPAVVEEAGFTAAFTTHARVLSSHDLQHPFHLPRVMLSRKAQSEWIVRAYHSGLPAMIRELWPRHEPLRIAPRLAQSDR